MAQRTRKGVGAQVAADPKHEQEHPGKTAGRKNADQKERAPGSRAAAGQGAEEAARKNILEEFNDREDLSERQLNNRNWL